MELANCSRTTVSRTQTLVLPQSAAIGAKSEYLQATYACMVCRWRVRSTEACSAANALFKGGTDGNKAIYHGTDNIITYLYHDEAKRRLKLSYIIPDSFNFSPNQSTSISSAIAVFVGRLESNDYWQNIADMEVKSLNET